MPVTYKPRLTTAVIAVKLKSEVIAPVGDWITIDTETDEVRHFTDAQFFSFYGRPDRIATKRKPTIAIVKKNPQSMRREDRVLSSQCGRFFHTLWRQMKTPLTTKQVEEATQAYDNPKSASAALSTMKSLGLVESSNEKPCTWTITTAGEMTYDRLKFTCFHRYGYAVPGQND